MKTADTLPDNGKTNEDYHDPIAKEVGRRLREGQHWRSNDRLGGKSVEQILTESYNQYHSILDPCDQELVDQSGIDVYVSPTAKKCRVLEAFMRDLIASDSQRLLQVRPTPIPDISEAGVEQVTEKLRASLSQLPPGSTPEQIRQIIRQLKDVQLQEEIILSEKEAKRQQCIISDQWTETRFLDQYMKFIHHLGRDPYAVMVGPIARGATVLQWSGNKMVPKYMENEYVKAYDPRDHFYSEDAQGKGTGKFEIVRERMSSAVLQQFADKPGWINVNVKRAVEKHHRNAMIEMNRGGREERTVGLQVEPDTIPVIRHYGKFSGKELQPYGISMGEDDFQYECMVLVINGYCCRIEVNADPTAQQRRVYTTSYQDVPDRIAGYGIAQLVRDIERMFMGSLRNMMQNAGASSMPMGEVDYTRIARYLAPGSVGSVMANTIMPVDPDPVGGGRPAHMFHTVPSQVQALTGLIQFFDQMADEFSGLPAALSGQPIGTGANRTFRGMTQLQGNAMKLIQSAFLNIDRDVFNPLIQTYHFVNAKKHNFRGDAIVEGSGVAGLLREELARQQAGENLQIIAQLSASAPQVVPQGVMPHAVMELLKSMQLPDNVLESPLPQPQAAGGQEPPAAQ